MESSRMIEDVRIYHFSFLGLYNKQTQILKQQIQFSLHSSFHWETFMFKLNACRLGS